ncbi:hypothetical protein Micbo1qcDRAFT_67637 [Microdochium bolleyi]|uniref:Uncharacterized protein n=1 Tax=Microdochium bolleyi TaxID=196109 RepID=A0A136J0U5_9PEZI|nr:hypothetical protein Micbo1qcDRAFT_67637 [Microdochium bolleyi]
MHLTGCGMCKMHRMSYHSASSSTALRLALQFSRFLSFMIIVVVVVEVVVQQQESPGNQIRGCSKIKYKTDQRQFTFLVATFLQGREMK